MGDSVKITLDIADCSRLDYEFLKSLFSKPVTLKDFLTELKQWDNEIQMVNVNETIDRHEMEGVRGSRLYSPGSRHTEIEIVVLPE